MAIKPLFPSELIPEITDLGANDYLVGQKAGESKLSKLKPAAIAPADIGALPTSTVPYDIGAAKKNGDLAQQFECEELLMPTGSTTKNALIRGTWDAGLGAYSWQFQVYDYTALLRFNAVDIKNRTASDWTDAYAKRFYSRASGGSPARTDIGFWMYNYNVGISSDTYNQLSIMTNGVAQGVFLNGEFASKTVRPTADITYRLGKDGNRYIDVWAQDTTINPSDATLKTDITDSDLGLEFIAALRPVSYRWIVAEQVAIPPEEEGGEMTYAPRAGVRKHYGLLAQEVKAALGERDFAGWGVGETTQTQFLRYSEFIAPLIKAVQELAARVKELEAATGGAVAS